MNEQEMRHHRCCFTGHRPEKLTRFEWLIKRDLEKEIRQAIPDGLTVFITGMAHRLQGLHKQENTKRAEPQVLVLILRVRVHVVRLPFIFEEDFEATKESLRKSINQIFV